MSEHTVEYALVTDLVRMLRPAFQDTVPMYVWFTREGNNTGAQGFWEKQFRLVSVFPRRPKVRFHGDDEILMKVNSSVLRQGNAARSLGIPVLAGVPLVSDLASYRIDSQCAWFFIDGTGQDDEDHEIRLTRHG